MAYSNRVSLDTDVIFLRTIFAFSTNNVPVSTNFIMAAGCNGQIIASDALRTLETYGIGYLPSTFSSFSGEIISVSLTVLSTGVTNSMLFSTQAYLLNTICSVQSNVNVLSSYVLENVIPSSFSTVNQQITELNSSFQGYIVSQAVTPVQLNSTTAGLVTYTDTSTSNLSTSVGTKFETYSNYVTATYTPLTTFYGLSTGMSTAIVGIYNSISTTNTNFVALSNYTRLTVQGLSTQVNAISNFVNTLSSTATDPFYTIGQMSSMQNVRFGSNIQVSSITSNIYLRGGNVGIGNTNPTSKLDVSGSAAITGNLAVDTNTLYVNATTNRVGIANGSPAYPLDVSGSINFTGGLYSNGVLFTGGGSGSANVLGTISAANQVYFGSNITTSTINVGSGTFFASNSNVGINCNSPQTFLALDVNGGTQIVGGMEMKYNPIGSGGLTIYQDNNTDPLFSVVVLAGTNKVGINTLTPGYDLDVSGNINFTGGLYSNGVLFTGGGGGTTNVLGILSTTDQVYFGSNITASTMNIDSRTLFASNGVVGIGTITPTTTLDVSGGAIIRGPLAVDNNIQVSSITSNIYLLNGNVGIGNMIPMSKLDVSGSAAITGNLAVDTNTLYVDATNNRVGIVNGSPSYTLDVTGDINFTGTLRQNGNPYGGGGGGAGGDVLGTISAANQVYFGSNITLSTMNLGGRTLFASNGVVGIGTSTPTTTLDVSGSAIIRGSLAAGSNIQVSSITSNIYLLNGNVGIGNAIPTAKLDVSGSATITGNLAVDTNTLYVDATNNRVGIVNATPAYPLDVSGSINFTGTLLQNGTPYSGGGGSANVLGTISAANQVYFGSNITLSTMNLGSRTLFASNGVVGIGTSTPTTTLDVSGSANITGNLAVDTNTFYVDAANNRVGIGTTSPALSLDVTGTTVLRGAVGINTQTPQTNLDVSGSVQIRDILYFGKSGSAATPILTTFANGFDTSTGLFFPGAGQIGITNVGVENYRFTDTAMFSFCNKVESVGYNSNKSAILDAGTTYGDSPNLTLTTSIGDTSGGTPQIQMITPSLTMKQFLVPATGTGFGTYDRFKTYMYPTAGGVNLSYVIDPSGQMGIAGDPTAGNALTVNGALNVTSAANVAGNLVVDTNTLYVNAATNRVGILCNSPSYALDVNGDTNLNGRIFSQNGNASAPAFGSINDQDSGIFFPGDGQVSITTNGTEKCRFSNATMYLFSNFVESVGYNSNKSITIEAGSNATADTTFTMKTNSTDTANGQLYLTYENGNLRMRQFLAPAAGGGVAQMNAFNVYMYPLPSAPANIAYVIDASGQMGIQGGTNTNTALTVNGVTNITSNLIVDTNTLYVNAGTNRVGVLCNSPSYALDVNGAVNIASGLSTNRLNVLDNYDYFVSSAKQTAGTPYSYIGNAGTLNNGSNNRPIFSTNTTLFSKYNMINVNFNIVNTTNQPTNGGGNWYTLRLDTDTVTNNSNIFTVVGGTLNTLESVGFNYMMILNRDYSRTDTYIRLMMEYATLIGSGEIYLTNFGLTGIY